MTYKNRRSPSGPVKLDQAEPAKAGIYARPPRDQPNGAEAASETEPSCHDFRTTTQCTGKRHPVHSVWDSAFGQIESAAGLRHRRFLFFSGPLRDRDRIARLTRAFSQNGDQRARETMG